MGEQENGDISKEALYNPGELETIKSNIKTQSAKEVPQLAAVEEDKVDAIVDNALGMIMGFEEIARKKPHQPVYPDTDAIIIFAGPGAYSTKVHPFEDKPDRYQHLPWSRGMERYRIRAAAAIAREVTGQRLGKPSFEVSKEEISENGPPIIYPVNNWEADHIKHVLAESTTVIPENKFLYYTEIPDKNGGTRVIDNTADQVEGLQLPAGELRRIVIVSQSAHLARILYMLGKFNQSIPPDTVLQPYPLRIPEGGKLIYPEMEIRGILAGIFKLDTASTSPYPFQSE